MADVVKGTLDRTSSSISNVSLADKYDLAKRRVYLSGPQAVARLEKTVRALDQDALVDTPVLLAATNSSGAVTGKMISPQNIAVGVTTVGLIGQEGKILRATFWHSVLLAAMLGLVALAQAYWVPGMVP